MVDILIIGSGAAGLTSALEAKKERKSVLVVSKTYPTHSQTTQAQGGINAVLGKSADTIQEHISDTHKSSHGIGDHHAIDTLCSCAKESIQWLDSLGVPFSRDDSAHIAQRKLGGAKHPRACYSSDYTGLKILHTLYDNCIKQGVEFLNEHMLLNLIVDQQEIQGATFVDIHSTATKQIFAKTVILATGGYSSIYHGNTTNSSASTGDGQAAALRAGAKLKNMEFVQFHPTALKDSKVLISESARGAGGYLVDSDGNRFVDELLPRDEVAREIYKQIEQNKNVYLDLRHIGKETIMELMPQEYELVETFSGLQLDKDLVSIVPVAHYSMGGIQTNEKCETNLRGLYACGECADNGVHGANRLGGNSLLELIVFGKIAAQQASEFVQKTQKQDQNEQTSRYLNDTRFIEAVFDFPNKIDFYEKKLFMGKIFYKNIGLFRTDMHMKAVLSQIRQWQKELHFMGIGDKTKVYNKNLIEFIEFGNMLELSEVIAVSAISRCESRGAHYRIDHPHEVPSYQKTTTAYKTEDGTLVVDFIDTKGQSNENSN